MNVLVIPEDFRKDRYMLQPMIGAMLEHLGKPYAKVEVCTDPLLGSVNQALRWERVEEILERYPMVDLFLLCVDRDGVETRAESLRHLENRAKERLGSSRSLLGENAWQELEVWVLAGHELPREWRWSEIRREIHPKEEYFEPFATSRGLDEEPGGGRRTLAQEAARQYKKRIRKRCPEDIVGLEARVADWLEAR